MFSEPIHLLVRLTDMSEWIDFSPEPIESRTDDPFFGHVSASRLRPLTPVAMVVGAILAVAAGVLWL